MGARFRNPSNGYEEEVSGLAWLWVLLFGCIYFAVKGVWPHAVAGFLLAFVMFGLSWLLYLFFAFGIMRAHYRRMGWREVRRGGYDRKYSDDDGEDDEDERPRRRAGRGPKDDFDFG